MLLASHFKNDRSSGAFVLIPERLVEKSDESLFIAFLYPVRKRNLRDRIYEVIKVKGKNVSVQVFESTRGLKNGDLVEFEGKMLEISLGPGLLSSIYDGLQNNLATMEDVFLKRGEYTSPLDHEKLWDFTPMAKAGDKVIAADWLGEVKEGWLPHKIMVPFSFKGTYTVKSIEKAGQYNIDHTIAVLTELCFALRCGLHLFLLLFP